MREMALHRGETLMDRTRVSLGSRSLPDDETWVLPTTARRAPQPLWHSTTPACVIAGCGEQRLTTLRCAIDLMFSSTSELDEADPTVTPRPGIAGYDCVNAKSKRDEGG